MLFDDDEQLEVRHVISLAHHDISIYSGGDVTPEGELFIKRNAICLSRKKDGPEIGPDSQLSKPFYLFSENCSAKEDFYFSLLRNQDQTFGSDQISPKPMIFDVKNIIYLVQKLHSSEEHMSTRWLNAMIGRVFLSVYRTKDMETFIREKITKKISRVKRPSFLSGISIRRIDTGESAPYITNPRLKDLTVEGECVVEADMRYNGNCRIEVAATARIDLGSRFKVREVDLVLAVVLRKLEGHILFKVKPPPSNRVWMAFQTMPKMEMTIEPIVSSRQITYTLILRQIENRIKEVIAESIVLPFWDDIPFFNTEHKRWRGGIWEGDDAVVTTMNLETSTAQEGDVDAVDRLEDPNEPMSDTHPIEKSQSLPVPETTPQTGLFGRRITGLMSPKLSASSTSVEMKGSAPHSPRPVRSDSLPESSDTVEETGSAPVETSQRSSSIESLDDNTGSIGRERRRDSTTRGSSGSPVRPLKAIKANPASSSSSSIDTTDSEKENELTPVAQKRRNTAASSESVGHISNPDSNSNEPSITGALRSHTGSLPRGLFARRENSSNSISITPPANSDGTAKRNTLAAVTNAAAQARQWGWNALQRHKDAKAAESNHVDLNQPMGRGRPLPPPGVPLPFPDKKSKPSPISLPKQWQLASPLYGDKIKVHASSDDHHDDKRPPATPSTQKRRQRSRDETTDDGENMLVVAAPAESEPGTPVTEQSSAFPSISQYSTRTETSRGADNNEFVSGITTPEREDHGVDDGPITAIPVISSDGAEDDDDGYSGWLDNTGIEEVEQENILPPKANSTTLEAIGAMH
jgi:hypothetical protein